MRRLRFSSAHGLLAICLVAPFQNTAPFSGWRSHGVIGPSVSNGGIVVSAFWSPAEESPPPLPQSFLSPLLFLSSKTPYYAGRNASSEVDELASTCTLLHINHLGRHGTREGTKLEAALRLRAVFRAAKRGVGVGVDGDVEDPQGFLHPLGEWASEAVDSYIAREVGILGQLTDRGREEHRGIAQRLLARHAGAISAWVERGRAGISAESTFKERVVESRESFLEGLSWFSNSSVPAPLASASTSPVPARGEGVGDSRMGVFTIHRRDTDLPCEASLSTPSAVNNAKRGDADTDKHMGSQMRQYSKLRFFDTCLAYLRFRESKPWANRISRFLVNATRPSSHEDKFLKQLFKTEFRWQLATEGLRLDAEDFDFDGPTRDSPKLAAVNGKEKEKEKDKKSEEKHKRDIPGPKQVHTAAVVADIYELCQIEASAQNILDSICSLFSGMFKGDARPNPNHYLLMRKQEIIHDVADYYKKGAGSEVAYTMACVLLEDMFAAMEDTIRHPQAAPLMHLRFAHAETVIPFVAILGVFEGGEMAVAESGGKHGGSGSSAGAGSTGSSQAPLSALEEHYIQQLDRGTSHLLDDASLAAIQRLSLEKESDTARFLHEALPLLKHTMSGSRLSPMAANVQWELFDCGDTSQPNGGKAEHTAHRYWLRMLHNEESVPFPPCDPKRNGGVVLSGPHHACPMHMVMDYYRKVVYGRHHLGTCSVKDWVSLCDGVHVPVCTS